MLYVGIDPSYSKTGIAYLDKETKHILFKAISPTGSNENYLAAISRAASISAGIIRELKEEESAIIAYEEPLLNSMKASRLGLLSGVLAISLFFLPTAKLVYTVAPAVVSSMNKQLPYKKDFANRKKLSLYVTHLLLDYLRKEGYTIDIYNDKRKKDGTKKARKLSHDEAEAFLILLQLVKLYDIFDEDVLAGMVKIHKGIINKYQLNIFKNYYQEI